MEDIEQVKTIRLLPNISERTYASLTNQHPYLLFSLGRETPEEVEIQTLPSSAHPLFKQLLFACLRSSPQARPNFKTICGVIDILLVQVYLIHQDYLENRDTLWRNMDTGKEKRKDNNNMDEDDNNNNKNVRVKDTDSAFNYRSILGEKYEIDEELVSDILEYVQSQGIYNFPHSFISVI